ncbi:MAG: FkbM family methyltransferase [Alphaproteobacteria bacterium]|nr:FkbM family methyltransferase [Alphaproteobacteria bacterium]
MALGEVARLVGDKYPKATMIDIGANIGDSAALIRKHGDFPLLCVEGNPSFGQLLAENIQRIGGDIEVEPSFIGPEGTAVAPDQILDDEKGSSRVVCDGAPARGGEAARMIGLQTLLGKHPRFANPRLVKIDTDGYDFFIITTSIDLLSRLKPVIFYECAIFERPGGPDESINAMRALIAGGYRHFIVYDNFGNFLVHLTENDMGKFIDLIVYLISNAVNGTAVYYYDICAFHGNDGDVFNNVRDAEVAHFTRTKQPT